MVEVIGVYEVNEDVHLIELKIDTKPSDVNVEGFTQEIEGVSKDDWQVAYDEYYLNDEGSKVIGDFFNKPAEDLTPTRIAFFLYFVDFTTPLLTPFGKVNLPSPLHMPERLKDIIEFEEVD
ncbi:hypothetical protein [Ureibacillus acetophenoni]|uniref:Uncharacterized protein n=1 Tax=Ureibacillus acetophenoni TaxID=614649 RepID=A0A285UTF2_9BACL|nr:hypothetical protein [Ureibacillus acetophenoni]SOC45089.1 hypothetical protein SAMN05877842_1323 [Ureibacillus acetophenoni]